jgi:glycosyltransferase involved in cell wall biosynthesis
MMIKPYSDNMPKTLSISIALCTYNGESFLWDQLNSFLNQTRLPDEVVICDDGSKDKTLKILEEFAAKAPFLIRIHQNVENLGWSKNFEKAITLCSGDLIALSDQDDEWLPDKLKKVEDIFKGKRTTGYISHNSALVGEQLEPLGTSLWDRFGYRQETQIYKPGEFIYLVLNNKPVFGHSVIFNSQLKKYLLPVPENCHVDWWIAVIGNMIMDAVLIPEPLSKYRQHYSQSIGLAKNNKWAKIKELKNFKREDILIIKNWWEEVLKRVNLTGIKVPDEKLIKEIGQKINHFDIRGRLPKSLLRRVLPIIHETLNGNYAKYSNSYGAILKDLIL